ncbi:hypothetical protein ACFPYI_00055 [Halomarina salina]|uniref:DUF5611 domain-containing protein n=1 Tax=Halomarina salina TaxID=1872699 RepID=A0ABD5RGZ7_9EURY|nr:hypothetical protein [Halomarina salina]
MGTIKFDVPDELEDRFREWAMKRFGHKRGSLGKAGEEAVSVWVAEQDIDLEITPAQNPILSKRGALSQVEASSTDLKHSVGEMLLEEHRAKRDTDE